MRYFEDIEIGSKSSFGHYEVTRDEVLAFATKFDPQPFHLDDDAAASTHFGRLSASGWHTTAMTMAMTVANMGTSEDHAGLGGIGVDELRWLKPVHPGDVLRCETEIIDKIPSRSRPEMGSFRNRTTVFNQDNVPVLTYITIALVKTRPLD